MSCDIVHQIETTCLGFRFRFYFVNMYVVQQFAEPLNLPWMLIMCNIESSNSAFQRYVPLNNIYNFVILTTLIWHLFAFTDFSGVSSYPGFSDIAIKIIVINISVDHPNWPSGSRTTKNVALLVITMGGQQSKIPRAHRLSSCTCNWSLCSRWLAYTG